MRNQNLDFIRGIAVLFVLYAHMPLSGLIIFGWTGVDMFFVLSGFLVTGLLFNELKTTSTIDGRLFLIRRGFKIYPLYYLFLLVAVICELIKPEEKDFWKKLFYEAIFIQNYAGLIGLHWHTWSLSIEEQFYFFLVLIFGVFIKLNLIQRGKHYFLYFFLLVSSVCLGFRIKTALDYPVYISDIHTYPTHLRIDSLLFGSLLAYYYTFYKDGLVELLKKRFVLLMMLSVTCFSSCLFIKVQDNFMHTFGFTLLYIAYGILLIYMVIDYKVAGFIKTITGDRIYTYISRIGFFSYSIYLWHTFVLHNIIEVSRPFITSVITNRFRIADIVILILYFIISILFGSFTGKYIEMPFLKIRDKYFSKKKENVL